MSFFHPSIGRASSASTSAQRSAVSDINRVGTTLLDLVLPPQCLKCGVVVGSSDTLCLSCWREFSFTTPPWCHACGLVLAFDPGADGLCASCARHAPAFERARSVFAYNEHSRTLILSFKNRDRTDAAPTYARWMTRAGADLLSDADFMVPVPLHWSRLYWRRYNQSALLALTLARETGLPAVPDLLVRRRRTLSLGRMSPTRRRQTLKGVFTLRKSYRKQLEGKRVLLIDDVLTTGATAQACTHALLQAGAQSVDVLTLARVMRPLPHHEI